MQGNLQLGQDLSLGLCDRHAMIQERSKHILFVLARLNSFLDR